MKTLGECVICGAYTNLRLRARQVDAWWAWLPSFRRWRWVCGQHMAEELRHFILR